MSPRILASHARCSDDEKNRWRFPPPWMENNVSQLPRQLVPNQVWNTLKAQFEKLFRQQDTVTRTSCNFVADLLTIQPTCAHSDAPNKGEEDKLQQKIQKNKNVFFPSTTTAATHSAAASSHCTNSAKCNNISFVVGVLYHTEDGPNKGRNRSVHCKPTVITD